MVNIVSGIHTQAYDFEFMLICRDERNTIENNTCYTLYYLVQSITTINNIHNFYCTVAGTSSDR